MAKVDRCPICGVSVRAENLLRHLNDIHPRHPEIESIREEIRAEGRPAAVKRPGAPFRIRRSHLIVLVVIVLFVLGGIFVAPYLDPYRNFTRDSCIPSENVPFHDHPFLRINIQGSVYPIPGNIGVSPACTKPLHTHSAYDLSTGFVQIHMESPVAKDFTLGDFFYIWGQPFSSTRILTYIADGTNRVQMTVDDAPSDAYGALVLRDGQQIVITYGP